METIKESHQISRKNRVGYGIGVLGVALIWLGAMGPGAWPFNSGSLTSAVHNSFSMLCHQLPNRALMINGNLTLVCARCTGFYSGLLVSWILLGLIYWRKEEILETGLNKAGYFLIAILVAIMLNVAGQFMGLWSTPNWLRFVLGIILGAALIAVIYQAVLSEKYMINLNSSSYEYYG